MAAPTGYPANSPKIIYNSKTLWLPRRFTEWKPQSDRGRKVTEGNTYTQLATWPELYNVKAKTANFPNSSAVWVEGEAAQAFLTAWATFQAWAAVGKVFSFYRKGDDSTANLSYFQYCVWTADGNGVTPVLGNERYNLTIEFRTEGAAR